MLLSKIKSEMLELADIGWNEGNNTPLYDYMNNIDCNLLTLEEHRELIDFYDKEDFTFEFDGVLYVPVHRLYVLEEYIKRNNIEI